MKTGGIWVFKHLTLINNMPFRTSGVNVAKVLTRGRSYYYCHGGKPKQWTTLAPIPARTYQENHNNKGVCVRTVGAGDGLVGVRLCAQDVSQDRSPGMKESKPKEQDVIKPYSSIPGPKPLPVVGNMFLFTTLGGYPLERYWETAQRLYERYGPVVKVERYDGKRDMVVVYRNQDTKKIFQAEGRYPQRPVLDILTYYRSKRPHWFTSPGLVPGNGPEWRRLRSAIHPLLRMEVVSAYRGAQTEVADDLVRAVTTYSTQINSKNNTDCDRKDFTYIVSDLLPLLFHYTLEAVGVVALGTRLGCLAATLPHQDNSGEERESDQSKARAQSVITANTETLAALGESIFKPPLYKIFPTRLYRRLAHAQDTIFSVVQNEVSRRRDEMRRDPEAFPAKHPFLAGLMTSSDLSPQDVNLLLAEVFQGGIDATATTLGFCVYFLAGHPDAQDQLWREVRGVQPATHSLQRLPYLRAVLQETLRLRPSASARSRVIQEDTVFSGYFVPAQTFVMSPPVVSCHDTSVFPEPHTFRPDRWLSSASKATTTTTITTTASTTSTTATSTPNITSTPSSTATSRPQSTTGSKIDPYTVLAFGHGARMCPGRRLAEQEIYLALIQLVKAYRLEVVQPGRPVGQVMRLNMMPDAPFAVAFTPRH